MSEKTNSYKDTLNLPKTDFSMRANLLEKEPAIQDFWKRKDIYNQLRKSRKGAERFILHDGPPYANGELHMGQALNKILKDIVVRYKNMTGFDAPFIPGWDCHGQPIEQKIIEQIGDEVENLTPMEIRRRCQEYAEKYVNIQSQQFQRLGVLGDFDNPYITMTPQYEADVLEVFARLVEQGLVFRQFKPVHWSIANRTALAEAELEYHDREDESIYVLLRLADAPSVKSLLGLTDEKAAIYLMIWTTTPWTLPANLAVAVHPDIEYAAVKFQYKGEEIIAIIAAKLVEKVLSLAGVEKFEILTTIRGAALADADIKYHHPLLEGETCPIVQADYVTLDEGTGLVHTAPGHGLEDYYTGLKYDLEIYCPVQEDGRFDQTAPDWLIGKTVWEANTLVKEYLDKSQVLFYSETIVHSYPHDWRSKTPTIFRATEQWFIGVDKPMKRGTNLREMALEACKKSSKEGGIDFIPSWGRNRLIGMLESRPDWCISRQRSWGLPIPAFYDEDGNALLTPAIIRAVAKKFAQDGSDCWFTSSPAELLEYYEPKDDPDLPNPDSFDVNKLKPGKDIFDVWFESGSSWFAAAIRRGLVKEIPVDLYLEGSDQHRGWFQLSLLPALASEGIPPYKQVLTHGFIVTEQGYKMSKSLGNAVDVAEQLSKRGADIIRLSMAGQNYHDDIRCSENLFIKAEEAYRKIRNTLRYCMGACFDFDPARHTVQPAEHSIDRWMKLQIHLLIRDVRNAYEKYEFHKALRMIYEFCTVEASSIYMSAVKDRLYCELPDSPRRRATQSVLHEMLTVLVKLLAPIIPHTAEEAWQHIPNRDPKEPESVHLAKMPEYDEEVIRLAEDLRPENPDIGRFSLDDLKVGPGWVWDRLLDLRQAALVKLEALRNSGVSNPLDAEVIFTIAQDDQAAKAFLEAYLTELEDMIGVGYARIEQVPHRADVEAVSEMIPIGVRVEDARDKYARCARSWKRRPDVGSDPDYPDLSARDAAVMKALSASSG